MSPQQVQGSLTSTDVRARLLDHHQSTPFRLTIDVTWARQ
jgi:hypothetical protein